MNNPITENLPADLPEDWGLDDTLAPDGTYVGLTEQHGYNYLMAAVNAAQRAAKQLGEALAALDAADVGALSLKGGEMGGDIKMKDHFIYLDEQEGSSIRSLTEQMGVTIEIGGPGVEFYSGGRMGNLSDPSSEKDAVNKRYVDRSCLSLQGGTMAGQIAMGNHKITGLSTPVSTSDASTKGYVDGKIKATRSDPGEGSSLTTGTLLVVYE